MNVMEKAAIMDLVKKLHDVWSSPHSWAEDAPDNVVASWIVFADTVINRLMYDNAAMPLPKWLESVKKAIAEEQPSTLQDGRTEFAYDTMTEPIKSGKFRKYAFTCKTLKGQTINLSVSPTLLERILSEVTAGHNFAITKQGQGINTNYVVEGLK